MTSIAANGALAMISTARQAYVRPDSSRFLEYVASTNSVRSRHISKLREAGVTIRYTGNGPVATKIKAEPEVEVKTEPVAEIESEVEVKEEDAAGDSGRVEGRTEVTVKVEPVEE